MSVQVSAWAWKLRHPPTLKLVLLALADQADDEGECWPSIKYIARKCCVSERTVQRALKQFEALGLISVLPRFKSGGLQDSNRYRLQWLKANSNCTPDKLSPSTSGVTPTPDTDATPGMTSMAIRGDNRVTQTTTETSIETPLQPPTAEPLLFPPQLCSTERNSIAKFLKDLPAPQAQLILDELQGMLERGTVRSAPLYVRGLAEKLRVGEFVPAAGINVAKRRSQTTPTNQANRTSAIATAKAVMPQTLQRGNHALRELSRNLKNREQP